MDARGGAGGGARGARGARAGAGSSASPGAIAKANRNKTNKHKRNMDAARKMLSRKVRRYFDKIWEESHTNNPVPVKLFDYIQRLIVEDISNDANNGKSLDQLLMERVK